MKTRIMKDTKCLHWRYHVCKFTLETCTFFGLELWL